MTDHGGPTIGLTVRRRTEYTRPNSIFQMAVTGNVEGVRMLLDQRLASPNDVNTGYGETPLWVSRRHCVYSLREICEVRVLIYGSGL